MGTNFYFFDDMGVNGHIGKRSAAGTYCWDCQVTLCKDGESQIHSGYSEWHDKCPWCGQVRTEESLDRSAAGRELGFNNEKPHAKTGVRGCASFSWGIDPDEVARYLSGKGGSVVVDEYGRKYTSEEFDAVLSECPVRFFGSIGVDFT